MGAGLAQQWVESSEDESDLGGLVNCWKSIKFNVMSLWDTNPAFIGFPQSTMSNRKFPFFSSVLPMIMGFSTYPGHFMLWSSNTRICSASGCDRVVWQRGTTSGMCWGDSRTYTLSAIYVQLLPDTRCISWLPYLLLMANLFFWDPSLGKNQKRTKCLSSDFNFWDIFRHHDDKKCLKIQVNQKRVF